MKLQIVAGLGFFVAFAASSDAAIISVTDAAGNADFSIVQGTPTTDVFVRIQQDAADAGNTNIGSAEITFAIGDGGPLLFGTDIVRITAVNSTGTGAGMNASIWDPQSSNLDITTNPPVPSNTAIIQQVNLNVPGSLQFGPGVTGNVLGMFTLDTAALTAGSSFALTADFGAGPLTTANWIDTGAGNALTPIPLSFNDGSLTVAAVPEPGSFVLLSVGAVLFICARRIRRRSPAGQSS